VNIMTPNDQSPVVRRRFLKTVAASLGGLLAGPVSAGDSADEVFELSTQHREAVNRRRRIVVQYDAQELYGIDFATWLDFRFRYLDEPGTQIDSVWWDVGRLGQVLYPSKFLDQLENADLQKWRDQGSDFVGSLIAETRRRGLEVFWHHRVSEVDINTQGTGAAWKDGPAPLKRAHPDWVLKTDWWRHGLWDFSVAAVREHTVRALREVAERYELDGMQLDFARHIPCLPPGRQWELRHHVTELMRSVRRMLLDIERKRGRPCLLAAKVCRTLDGCRSDGLDVEAWVRQNLVDILTLGSRSVEVDVAAFRRVTAGRNIKLQPCFDDHHTTDGYRYAPIEVVRGVFANWWQQGADGVVTFNWSNAPPEVCQAVGAPPGPLTHRQAYREIGSSKTMEFKDKTFVVERRGGYPWAEGFFNRNDTAPLPLALAAEGTPATIRVRLSDDLAASAARVKSLCLRTVLFNAADDQRVAVRLNGFTLPLRERDPQWKDPQIFSPRPQPASGGTGDYRIDPRQRLLRLDFAVTPNQCKLGENVVSICLAAPPPEATRSSVALEKLEFDVRYV